jgi:hypothetical protein
MNIRRKWQAYAERLLSSERLLRRLRVAIIATFALFAMSCNAVKTTRQQDNETTRRQEVSVLRDSIVVRDTLIYKVSGDTIRIEQIKWRDRFVRDTVRISDTVRVSEIKEIKKEKKVIDWWGCLSFCGLVAFFVWAFKQRLKRN